MAVKLALLLRRRSVVVLALSAVASCLGAVHGHHGGFGFWDGPI